jgi:hypothetical protein
MIQMSSDNMSRDSGSSLVDFGDENLLFISEMTFRCSGAIPRRAFAAPRYLAGPFASSLYAVAKPAFMEIASPGRFLHRHR